MNKKHQELYDKVLKAANHINNINIRGHNSEFDFSWSKVTDKDILQNIIYDDFINNVLCRNESNQLEASKIFKILKQILPKEDIADIQNEWSHYKLNELSTEEFGNILKKIKEKNVFKY